MTDFKIPIGQIVTWTSQASGSTKEKTGIVRSHLPERYLVEVERKHAKTGETLASKWYTPRKSVIESQNVG